MPYCERPEVREMMKGDTLNALIGDEYLEDEAERETRIGPIIDKAIEDADGEIDGYLAKRYRVPLSPVPGVIRKFSKDIAYYNVFSRVGIDEGSEQKNILNRYNAAVKFLTLVAEGKVDIGASDVEDQARVGFQAKSNRRLFTRDSMRGM